MPFCRSLYFNKFFLNSHFRRETGLEQGEQQRVQRRQIAERVEREQGPLRLEGQSEVAVKGQGGRGGGGRKEQEVEFERFEGSLERVDSIQREGH